MGGALNLMFVFKADFKKYDLTELIGHKFSNFLSGFMEFNIVLK